MYTSWKMFTFKILTVLASLVVLCSPRILPNKWIQGMYFFNFEKIKNFLNLKKYPPPTTPYKKVQNAWCSGSVLAFRTQGCKFESRSVPKSFSFSMKFFLL